MSCLFLDALFACSTVYNDDKDRHRILDLFRHCVDHKVGPLIVPDLPSSAAICYLSLNCLSVYQHCVYIFPDANRAKSQYTHSCIVPQSTLSRPTSALSSPSTSQRHQNNAQRHQEEHYPSCKQQQQAAVVAVVAVAGLVSSKVYQLNWPLRIPLLSSTAAAVAAV